VSAARVDDLIDAFQAAWSSGDRGAFRAMCTPDVHYEDPFCEEPAEGADALADHAVRLWQAFPDARVERAGARLTDGQFVAAPVKVVATNRGDLGELPATGRFVVVHAVLFCELDARRERLWRVRAFFDGYGAARQLGILPQPGSLSERALLMLRGFGLRARP
jgi:steroid delta-isomerase-like uncharacterized protein